MFGDNEDFACIDLNDNEDIGTPHQIDDIVKKECGIEQIIEVKVGYYNTIVICQ